MLVYLSIFFFAILEGEIYYIAMCVLAGAASWSGKASWSPARLADRRAINSGSTCFGGASTGSIAIPGSPGIETPSSTASGRTRR